MVSDSSSDSRKVDKRTALALWDTSALPGGLRKKRTDNTEGPEFGQEEIMKFTLISKKGGKTQVRELFVNPIKAVSPHYTAESPASYPSVISISGPHTFSTATR